MCTSKHTFDFINIDIIWCKLIKSSVGSKILNIIKCMYAEIKARVKFNNLTVTWVSDRVNVYRHFFFSMYLNEIEEEFDLNGLKGIDIGTI